MAKLFQLQGVKGVSVWDVLGEMRWLFEGHREDEPQAAPKGVDVSRMLTGK